MKVSHQGLVLETDACLWFHADPDTNEELYHMMPPQRNRAFLPHHDALQYSETQSGNKFLLHALALPGS